MLIHFLETLPISTIIVMFLSMVFYRNLKPILKYNIILLWFASQLIIVFIMNDEFVNFYSNDHLAYIDFIERGKDSIIGTDHPTIHRIIFSYIGGFFMIIGLNPSTFLKSVNILAYIYTLSSVKRLVDKNGIGLELWRKYWMIFAGQSVFFFALVGNRDVVLVALMVLIVDLLIDGKTIKSLIVALIIMDFRSHLGIACIVGIFFSEFGKKNKQKIYVISMIVICLLVGNTIYSIVIDKPVNYNSDLFIGYPFFLNGLSFLFAPEYTRPSSIIELFAWRLIFFDSLLVPTFFVFSSLLVFVFRSKIDHLSVFLLTTAALYFGISYQSDFYSFRQTIQFIPIMGICTIRNLQYFRNRNTKTTIALKY